MARIRSIHPGLATDEAFMAMSAYAMVAWPLLWTECDDHGAFEWKPIVLKARLLPAANVDFGALMEEWVTLGVVKKIDIEGRSFGLVRNFCRFQRPKKPKYIHDIPDEFLQFIASCDGITEPDTHDEGAVGDEGGTGTELSPQMEEGGGRRKGSLRSPKSRGSRLREDWRPSSEDREYAISQGVPDAMIYREGEEFRDYWIAQPGQRGVKIDWPATWRNHVRRLCDRRGFKPSNSPAGNGEHKRDPRNEEDAKLMLSVGRDRQMWPRPKWGPMPNEPGCLIPAHLIKPDDGKGWEEWHA